jgi:hypothetical protein
MGVRLEPKGGPLTRDIPKIRRKHLNGLKYVPMQHISSARGAHREADILCAYSGSAVYQGMCSVYTRAA